MSTLPLSSGVGLKAQHYQYLLENPNSVGWLEVHPENYMGAGGAPHQYLTSLRENYPLSMHGVGMSLGSSEGIHSKHLQNLKALVDRYQPEQVSEHLSWSHWNSHYLNDLLPLPYTKESLQTICNNIDKVQNILGRHILIENPSTYIDFTQNDYSETDMFREIIKKTGCGILLDINNVYVCANNHEFSAQEYLDAFPIEAVEEVHLAGHTRQTLTNGKEICIDDHGSAVTEAVWTLYEYFISNTQRAFPTLIEWDTDVPNVETLLSQAALAEKKAIGALS
ncbi:MAG: DUF692 domain-containing protein [Agarilytica sp.]